MFPLFLIYSTCFYQMIGENIFQIIFLDMNINGSNIIFFILIRGRRSLVVLSVLEIVHPRLVYTQKDTNFKTWLCC